MYSVTVVLMIIISLIFSTVLNGMGFSFGAGEQKPDWYLYWAYILPQLAFVLAIGLFFLCTEAKPKEVYKGAKWQYFLLAVLLQFGLFSLSGLNGLFLEFLKNTFGYEQFSQIPSTQGWNILPVILVIAVLPAVFEESIFRGLLLNPLKKLSTPVAVLLSGALFALYHQNPAQTIYQFCCGCAFALIAIRANSVLPTMLSHFLNNAFIIVCEAFGIQEFSGMGGVFFYIISAVALITTLGYLLFFDKNGNEKKSENATPFFATAAVGIAVCVVTWLANLVEGVA